MRLASGSDWLGKLTPPNWRLESPNVLALYFTHAERIFENAGAALGRAVL